MRNYHQLSAFSLTVGCSQYVSNLLGRTDPLDLNNLGSNSSDSMELIVNHLVRQLLFYVHGEHERADEDRIACKGLHWDDGSTMYRNVFLHAMYALNACQMAKLATKQRKVLLYEHLAQKHLKKLSNNTSRDVGSLRQLIQAQQAAHKGKTEEAVAMFQTAAKCFGSAALFVFAAIALECAAQTEPEKATSEGYYRQAWVAYRDYGAIAKCRQLEECYEFLGGYNSNIKISPEVLKVKVEPLLVNTAA